MEGRSLARHGRGVGGHAPAGRCGRPRGSLAGNWEDWASVAIFLVAPLVTILFLHFLANDGY